MVEMGFGQAFTVIERLLDSVPWCLRYGSSYFRLLHGTA